jgi:hypothetical protein
VNSAPAASINVVSGNAQTAVVGTALAQPLVVKVSDTNGNAVAGFTLAWAVATGAAQVSTGTTTTGPDGKASITATLGTVAGAFSFTAAGSGLTGSPTTFTATGIPDVATTLVLTGFPSPVIAGTSGTLTVTAQDRFNNTATGYRGTVQIGSDNPNTTTLPANHTYTVIDAGVHTFAVTLKTSSASSSIIATDTLISSITGSQTAILVNPGTTTKLLVTDFPNPASADTGGSVTVTAADANNNTTPAYRGTVQVVTSDNPNSTLPMTHAFIAGDNGVFTFTDVILKKASPPSYAITATDTVTASITGSQTAIVVNPGTTTKLLVTGFPNPASADTGGSVTVTAQDANNNTTPAYRGMVRVASDNPNSTLPMTHAFIAGDNGVFTFTGVILKKASPPPYFITATDTLTAGIAGTQGGIVVNPGPTTKLQVAGFPSSVFGGTPGSVTVTAQDANNNTTPPYIGTVRLTSTDTRTNLPATHSFTGTDAGVHTFTNIILNTTGANSSIVATDTVTGAIAGKQTGIVVNAGPLVFGATATVITGGTNAGFIFISGGSASSNGTSPLSNTWLYDPATSSLTAGPALTAERAFHTATPIGAGKVMVAGGNSTVIEVCTLMGGSPACSDTTATLGSARCNSAAAPLSGTQVLIAGGDNCTNTNALDTWDVWDSASPTTTVSNTGTNKLSIGRRLLTATVVGTGKVLLAGGATSATADLFTLGAPSIVAATTGGMLVARTGHTATILTAITATTACPNAATTTCVLIAGGNATTNKTWEVYEASSNSFPVNATTAGNHDLVNPLRSLHSAAAFAGGKVLLAGGNNGTSSLKTTEVFDPAAATLTFNLGVGLQLGRFSTAAAYAQALNVLVLVGGNAVGPSTEQITTP